MSGSAEGCALVVEQDRDLQELFEMLLKEWSLRFVRNPWTLAAPPPGEIDLLVIDEDYTQWSDGKTPEWLTTLSTRLPTIVIRELAEPRFITPSVLVLPKPFPISRFLAFANTVRREKTARSLPDTGP